MNQTFQYETRAGLVGRWEARLPLLSSKWRRAARGNGANVHIIKAGTTRNNTQVLLSVVRPSEASNSLTAGTNIASVVKPYAAAIAKQTPSDPCNKNSVIA